MEANPRLPRPAPREVRDATDVLLRAVVPELAAHLCTLDAPTLAQLDVSTEAGLSRAPPFPLSRTRRFRAARAAVAIWNLSPLSIAQLTSACKVAPRRNGASRPSDVDVLK